MSNSVGQFKTMLDRAALNTALRDAAAEYHNASIELRSMELYSYTREEERETRARFRTATERCAELARQHAELMARGE